MRQEVISGYQWVPWIHTPQTSLLRLYMADGVWKKKHCNCVSFRIAYGQWTINKISRARYIPLTALYVNIENNVSVFYTLVIDIRASQTTISCWQSEVCSDISAFTVGAWLSIVAVRISTMIVYVVPMSMWWLSIWFTTAWLTAVTLWTIPGFILDRTVIAGIWIN